MPLKQFFSRAGTWLKNELVGTFPAEAIFGETAQRMEEDLNDPRFQYQDILGALAELEFTHRQPGLDPMREEDYNNVLRHVAATIERDRMLTTLPAGYSAIISYLSPPSQRIA